jgi:hypothetical protein
VPHKFLAVTQRLGRENGVVADNDGVFQAAAFDEAVLDEELDLLKKTKRPRVGDFADPGLRRKFDAEELGETAFGVGAGASDLEPFVRKNWT